MVIRVLVYGAVDRAVDPWPREKKVQEIGNVSVSTVECKCLQAV